MKWSLTSDVAGAHNRNSRGRDAHTIAREVALSLPLSIDRDKEAERVAPQLPTFTLHTVNSRQRSTRKSYAFL